MEPIEEPLAQEPSTPEVKPTKKPDALQFRLSKKVLWWSGVVLVVLVLAFFTWHNKWYAPVYAHFNSGTISLKVKEGDKFPLEGATVVVQGTSYTTDSSGKITIARILKGAYTAKASKDGYTSTEQSFTVKRGDNDMVLISLNKVPEKRYTISGAIQDTVSGKPLLDVEATLAGTTKHTNPNGEYSFPNLAPGDYKLILSKAGYLGKELQLTIKTADISSPTVPLVPTGQVIFVSNRDGGKRALYVANYDGSGQQQFVPPQSGGEDYGQTVSPDNKWVVFSSTRDQAKTPYGQVLAKLYIVARDGSGIKKLNDDLNHSSLLWSPNSRYLYYQAYTSVAQNQQVQRFYDVSKGTVFDLGEDSASQVVFDSTGTSVAYVISTYGEDGKTTYTNRVKTLNLQSGERKTLVTKDGNSFNNLTYANGDKAVAYDVTIDSTRHRYVVTTDSAQESEVSVPTEDTRVYLFSPDGKTKVFRENRDGKEDIFLVKADGSEEKKLTSLGVVNTHIPMVWDESGRYLTFAVTREGENALYVLALAGGDPKKVVDFYADNNYPGYY